MVDTCSETSPAAAQVYTATSSARPALRPPGDLNELEREVFADIVLGCGPHHFVPVDVPLIAILACWSGSRSANCARPVIAPTSRARRGWRSCSSAST